MAYSRAMGANFDVRFRDLARGGDTLFTAGGLNFASAWSPRGDRRLFTRGGGGFGRLYVKAVSGSGQAESLVSADDVRSEQWSRDGRFVVFTRRDLKTREDLWVLPMDDAPSSDRNPKPFLQTQFSESQGQLSPDSRWMAYTSDESGERNVYVRAFPSADTRGWCRRRAANSRVGEETARLFYIPPDGKVTGVIVASTPAVGLELGLSRALFDSHLNVSGNTARQGVFQYDVTADGERFVIVETVGSDKLRRLSPRS